MAIAFQRLLRIAHSTCAPVTTIICFSLMLTFLFILYHPTRGPGDIQRLGWQSWDVITMIDDDSSASVTPGESNVGLGTGNHPSKPETPDWWNVTNEEGPTIDSATLPLDVWSPLLPHDTGLSDIAVTRCMVDPSFVGDLCAPSSTSEEDSLKGKWVRVDRNLNRQSGVWYLHLYYRRTRRQDIPLIDDIQLLPEGELPSPSSDSWHKVSRSLRDGIPRAPKLFLWYHLGKKLIEMSSEEKQGKLITELDVLYGEDIPWYGFEKLSTAITAEQEGRIDSVYLTYRRGVKVPPKAPPLHFSHSGKFKILQIADLHFSVSRGICRDVSFSPCSSSDNLTNSLLSRIVSAESPDLVVFTGDQLNGQGTSWDAGSVLSKATKVLADKKIPWAAVFGNHDSEDEGREGRGGREEQIKMMQGLPYSVVQRGPKDIHGVGNYVLKVMSADASKTHILTLYFLDSGSYSRGFLDWFGFFTPTEYDYLRQSQIDWFLQASASVKPIERPFTPDTGKDFGDIWVRQSIDQITPQTRKLAKPNALMFFHIPLQESYNIKPDIDPTTNKPLDVGLHGLEPAGSPKRSEGFFEKALLEATESDHVATGNVPEVKVVGNGHCHVTENCRRIKGVWLCFGGGGSYSGYGKPGFDRRFRIYEISDYGETIRTWKRTDKDEILDDMILSGRGAPPLAL